MIHISSEGKVYGLEKLLISPLHGSVNVTNFVE